MHPAVRRSAPAGVWVGYDQPRTIRANGYASDLAVPLWTQFMKMATRGVGPRWLEPPRGMDGERLRGGVAADGDVRTPKKRGFWARLFGLGDERRRGDDRRDGVVIVDDDERKEHERGKRGKERKREKDRERGEGARPGYRDRSQTLDIGITYTYRSREPIGCRVRRNGKPFTGG
jgi:membrane carboxypeptidase/penicillin-binding protein